MVSFLDLNYIGLGSDHRNHQDCMGSGNQWHFREEWYDFLLLQMHQWVSKWSASDVKMNGNFALGLCFQVFSFKLNHLGVDVRWQDAFVTASLHLLYFQQGIHFDSFEGKIALHGTFSIMKSLEVASVSLFVIL